MRMQGKEDEAAAEEEEEEEAVDEEESANVKAREIFRHNRATGA